MEKILHFLFETPDGGFLVGFVTGYTPLLLHGLGGINLA